MKFNYIILSLLIISPILIQTSDAYLSIPPTRAFSIINSTNGNVTATSYMDFVEFIAGSGITIAFNYAAHEITFNATSAPGSGFTNIASAPQTSATIISDNYTNANSAIFKTLTAGSGITLTNNTQDVVIAATGGGGNATALNDLSDVVISSPAYPSILFYDNGMSQWINKIFTLQTTTCGVGNFVTAINNQTGAVTCTAFSGVNSLNFTTSSDFDFSFGGNASGVTLNGQVFEFRLKNNIVLTNESAQTVTKSLTLNSLTLGGAANANNQQINSLGAPSLAGDAARYDSVKINSSPQTSATIITDNQTLGSFTLKTLTQGTGITLTNGSQAVTITSSITQGFTNITPVSTTANATLIQSNSSNTAVFKNIGGSANIRVDNGTDTIQIVYNGTASSGITSLIANITSTKIADYTEVWAIPLTASSGNTVEGIIVASSTLNGGAVQLTANVTQSTSTGICNFITPLTSSTQSLDFFVLNNSNPTVDTAETVWLPVSGSNQPLMFTCSVHAGATPGNLRILMQAEVASTITAEAGSRYIKTP